MNEWIMEKGRKNSDLYDWHVRLSHMQNFSLGFPFLFFSFSYFFQNRWPHRITGKVANVRPTPCTKHTTNRQLNSYLLYALCLVSSTIANIMYNVSNSFCDWVALLSPYFSSFSSNLLDNISIFLLSEFCQWLIHYFYLPDCPFTTIYSNVDPFTISLGLIWLWLYQSRLDHSLV